jgi:signal transduction histidine kinase
VLPLGSRNPAGEAKAALVIIRDETERLALERSTARARDLLDLVVRMLGHDMKAPLSVIQGYLEMDRAAIKGAKGPQDYAPVAAHMEKMAEAVVDMQVLMGNARSLSRLPGLDEAEPKLTELDLTRTVRQMVDLLLPIARSRNVSLEGSLDERVAANVVLGFDSVPRNLIDNAIKYTPPGGAVEVSLAVHDGKVVLRVADTGPGIPPGKEDQLFRKFERLGAEKGSTEGHGLGLSIVAKLVELSKGTIRLGDRQDGRSGAVFVVELPAASPSGGPPRAGAP